jgi:hypothetical protein
MRFHHRQPPPPLLTRRQQWRLSLMVVMLALVVYAIRASGKPENWRWFFELSGQPVAQDQPRLQELDFKVRTDGGSLPPDVFRSEMEPAAATADVPAVSPAVSPTDLPPGLLDHVRDNHLGNLRAEQPAIETVINTVRNLTPQQMEAAAERDVAFTVLMVNAEQYRGRIIALRGTLRRLSLYDRGDPADPHDDLYEAWLRTADAGDNPCRVLVSEAPPSLPQGDELHVEVLTHAYFIKRYGYVSQGGTHVAPMLIGKTLQVVPVPPSAAPAAAQFLGRIALGVLLGLGALFAAVSGWLLWGDRRARSRRVEELAALRLAARTEDLEALKQADVVDTGTMLQRLRVEEPQAPED